MLMADYKHENSVRGQLERMAAGEIVSFDVKRMLFVKNVASHLNTMNFGVKKWSTHVVREEHVIEVTRNL